MTRAPRARTGGQILIDALRIHGVDRVFCVPGESYLAALDALHDAADAIELIVCRQEGGAAYMAEAHGKLTGKPGICFVTRGPGAANASVGVHTAFQDSTPMILGEIMAWLREHLPEDAIITTGAGNYSAWAHRFYQYRSFRTQLGPTNGSMGYGTPAAIAAKLADRDRTVVAFAGDGCFLMNGQEIATAAQYDARIIVLVINNGMYGTIRMHQERSYPGRVSGTALSNPDFAAMAKAYGLHGEIVATTEDFAGAFERCEAAGKPGLIEIRIDPEALTPKMSLSEIRNQALSMIK